MKTPLQFAALLLAFAGVSLPSTVLAAPIAVAKSAVVAGPTALPALSVSSGTPTGYTLTYTTSAAGTLYIGSTAATAGANTVAVGDVNRLRFVPATSLTTNTPVSFTYTAQDASGTSAAVTYSLTVVRAATLDFSTRTAGEDWATGRSVNFENTTLTGSTYTYSANATTHALAVGNPSNRLPGTALSWSSTYGSNTNPGTDAVNNTSAYTFTFAQPVANFSLTLTDIDLGTNAAGNGSDFIDDVTIAAYTAAGSTTPVGADGVSMATVVNAAAATVARTAGTNTLKGTANNNAAVNGTLLISVAARVQRVVITYKNSAAYVAGNARIQNLGIASLTWAAAVYPLPVELTQFTAAAMDAHAGRLDWTTASEKNSAFFAIERSTTGEQFSEIGRVNAQGSTATTHTYSYTDRMVSLPARTVYYRLRQVDQDGTSSYSPVRSVVLGSSSELALYPNPARGMATAVGLPAGTTVGVYDLMGRPVAQATADARGTAPLALPAGVYVVRAGRQSLRLTVE